MYILICKQGLFGGTDNLLERLYDWMKNNKMNVDIWCRNDSVLPVNLEYDLAILPSSQIGEIYYLLQNTINVKSILVWIMGMGTLSNAYYSSSSSLFGKVLKLLYHKEVKRTLAWLIQSNAIAFTDGVSVYNTYKTFNISYDVGLERNIFPIAINVPESNRWEKKSIILKHRNIRVAWIGRVSSDFKEIPIRHLLHDLNAWNAENEYNVCLTIVGNGDALQRIKSEGTNVSYHIEYIDNVSYEKLNEFILNNVDLLIAMGTSALDGAKVGCPTAIITPVRSSDSERVEYRWIYESKGFSLGEFPDVDIETNQRRCSFSELMNEYISSDLISDKCFSYAKKFDTNSVFDKLLGRTLPKPLDDIMIAHIRKFYQMKELKCKVKRIIGNR